MKTVSVCYDHGISDSKDKEIETIAKQYGAKFIGSGCWLVEPMTRDLQYEVSDNNLKKLATAIMAAGYNFTTASDDDEAA